MPRTRPVREARDPYGGVILSERSESKDLRISFPFAVNLVPSSLDALRLLGMTAFFAVWEPAKIVNCQLSIAFPAVPVRPG